MLFPYPLTARQRRIADLAEDLAQRLGPIAAEHDRRGDFALENLATLHEAGYLRLALPEVFGGEGADAYDMAIAQQRLARGDPASALVVGMTLNVLGRLRDDPLWPDPVYAAVCRDIAAHGGAINTCATEADLGSVSRGGAPAATATPTDGGYLVNGRKIFVTGAPGLRWLVTLVRLPPTATAPYGEVASAIVAANSPGLSITESWSGALSLRSCGNSDVDYADVFVAEEFVVERRPLPAPGAARPPEGKGAPGLGPWSLTIAAVYLGIGEASLEAATRYANSRRPTALGRPIAETPQIQERIGAMAVALEAARAQLYETARLWRDHPELREQLLARIAAAKYLCTNAACQASEAGLRVAGGFSLTADLSLERHFRDARAGLFQPPQDDLALGFIGRDALAAARSATALYSEPSPQEGKAA
jgi:alkylation response protein AidB-like acyl-CoA dehydrogenase